MNFRVKLPLAISAIVLLVLAAGLFSVFDLNRSLGAYVRTIEFDRANERISENIALEFKTQVQESKDLLLRGKDQTALETHWHSFESHVANVTASTGKLIDALPEGEVRDLVEKFAQAHAKMTEAYRRGFETFKAARFDPSAGDAAVMGLDRDPSILLDAVRARIDEGLKASVTHASQRSRQSILFGLVVMALAGIAGIVGVFVFFRAIVRPVDDATTVARAIAAGDLTSKIDVRSEDEIGQLAQSLNDMQESLRRLVGDVRAGVDSVGASSAQIAVGNLDLRSRTEQQAASLEETAASMEQLTATVKQSADNAKQANPLAGSASAAAAKGGEVVRQVISTMEEIAAASKKISEIINVIDGIAFQTNILALNAAVEAARAGEQGRGFAVVAGEVRSLAQRSAQAAREIKSMISDSVEKVDAGNKLVNSAGASMSEIVGQVQRVADLIGEISAAAQEQSLGIGQVNEAVTRMDRVTQDNAALVEESAAAAANLRDQAGKLDQAVSVFRLSSTESCNAVA